MMVSMLGFTRSPSPSSAPERTHSLRDHSDLTSTAEPSLEAQERTQDVAGLQHFHLQPARTPTPARRTVRARRVARAKPPSQRQPRAAMVESCLYWKSFPQIIDHGLDIPTPPTRASKRISTSRRPRMRPWWCRPGCHRCPSRCCSPIPLRRPRCCRHSPLPPRTRTRLPHWCWKP